MFLARRAFALILIFFVGNEILAEAPLGDSQGFVVLRNGRVLRGAVLQVGDEYRLSYPNGDEVRLPVSSVELCCRSLNEAYELKRFAISANNSGDQLDLADWCVTQGLLDQADSHVRRVEQLDPKEPRISFIRRRIAYAKRPIVEKSNSTPKVDLDFDAVDSDELEDLISRLPINAVGSFTSHIQPLLINRCSAGGCHGHNSDAEFRLLRTSVGRLVPRIITQRNLHSVIQQLDADRPLESPILKRPLVPHGTAKRAIFSPAERKQHDLLTAWVKSVTATPNAAVPRKIGLRDAHLLQASGIDRPTISKESDKEPPTKSASRIPAALADANVFDAKPASFVDVANSGDVNSGSFVPVDPFDPEIFNRRFSSNQADNNVVEKPSRRHSAQSLIPFRKNSPRSRASRN